jgi:hypothetical protein
MEDVPGALIVRLRENLDFGTSYYCLGTHHIDVFVE